MTGANIYFPEVLAAGLFDGASAWPVLIGLVLGLLLGALLFRRAGSGGSGERDRVEEKAVEYVPRAEYVPREALRESTSGEALVMGVDDETAAIILAAVGNEAEIPLSELKIKKIVLVQN